MAHEIVTDNTDDIVAAIDKVKAAGADIIFCTGGMSVDPDDLTPGAIKRYADRVVTYGLPVLPGLWFVLRTVLMAHRFSAFQVAYCLANQRHLMKSYHAS